MTSIAVIYNPAAGRRSSRKKLQELKDILPDAQWLATEHSGHARELAAQSRTDGVELIVVAGGDGTVSEVAGGLVDAEGRAPELLVWPMGSGNDFVANTKSARGKAEWLQALHEGTCRKIDAGCLEVLSPEQSRHHFFNNSGFGLEADVIAKSNEIRSVQGLPLYLIAALRALRGAMLHSVITQLGDQPPENKELTMVSVANGVRSGGGFRLLPPAEPDDGLLDIGFVRMPHRRTLLRLLGLMLIQKHLNSQWIEYTQTPTLELAFPQGITAHTDGELLKSPVTKARISIIPKSLRVRVP